MDTKKVLEVSGLYKRYFEARGCPAVNYPHDECMYGNDRNEKILAHCHSMLDKTEKLAADGSQEQKEKALIRLGFVQCGLWATGHYTIAALSANNHSDTEGVNTDRPLELLTEDEMKDWEYGE